MSPLTPIDLLALVCPLQQFSTNVWVGRMAISAEWKHYPSNQMRQSQEPEAAAAAAEEKEKKALSQRIITTLQQVDGTRNDVFGLGPR